MKHAIGECHRLCIRYTISHHSQWLVVCPITYLWLGNLAVSPWMSSFSTSWSVSVTKSISHDFCRIVLRSLLRLAMICGRITNTTRFNSISWNERNFRSPPESYVIRRIPGRLVPPTPVRRHKIHPIQFVMPLFTYFTRNFLLQYWFWILIMRAAVITD